MNKTVLRCLRPCKGYADTLTSIYVPTRPKIHQLPLRIQPPAQRSFSNSLRLHSQAEQEQQPSSTPQTQVPNPQSQSSDLSIPWYLQVETPSPSISSNTTTTLPLLQELPTLPPNAPPILLPILTHLSTQIGLDNLSLLDLRHLDPPPALGANLLMIIGTARSVKHLNVSADRFCRWTRSTYKLRPYADGLLGRNELKLKLRRRARKLKLAQSVGNTVAMDGRDDGITTGWICVNLGPIDHITTSEELETKSEEEMQRKIDVPGEDEEEYINPARDLDAATADSDNGYIGFGSRHAATRIVVQMFTEDKRVEMDLEGLWDVRSARRKRRMEERVDVESENRLG